MAFNFPEGGQVEGHTARPFPSAPLACSVAQGRSGGQQCCLWQKPSQAEGSKAALKPGKV